MTPSGVADVLYVVPTLGERPVLLGDCLTSIGDQQVPGVDLVVVAPPGRGIEAVAATHGARFVPDTRRAGIAGAINAGLAAAEGSPQFFAWLGDDDYLTPGSLALTRDALLARPDATLAFGWCDYVDEHRNVVFRSRAGRLAAATITFGPNLVPQPGSLMRFEHVVAVGGIDESVRLALDLDLFLRLRQRGRLVSVPATVAAFRWHATSSTVANGRESMEESDRVRMRYMSRSGARVYEYARWPGRWALAAAKGRASRNAAKAMT